MLKFAAIAPHPPIIVPGIGQAEDIRRVASTVEAMKKLASRFEKAAPDTVILFSPHAPIETRSFLLNLAPTLEGSLSDFGSPEVFSFDNDIKLAEEIKNKAQQEGISVRFWEGTLDHGALVPLYYLTRKVKPRLVHCSFSFLDLPTHFLYGKIIRSVVEAQSDRSVAVIASGDLSHRLQPGAPAGYSPKAKEFDEMLIEKLANGDIEGILELDEEFIQEAGECGLRSIVILIGVLEGRYDFQQLSYEGPFGVGYLVAELKPI